MSPGYFVQVGATRDGLDPYLDAARRRGMAAVLVETPAYLRWRAALGHPPFDIDLPVEQISSAQAVADAVTALGGPPRLLLAGFERYVRTAFAASAILGVPPTVDAGRFVVPGKADQRAALSAVGLDMFQPRYLLVESLGEVADACDELGLPAVLKPSNGSSGLGVFLILDKSGVVDALAAAAELRNYDGGGLDGWLVEEYSVGREYSVQAVAIDGHARILTFSEKLVRVEGRPDTPGMATFWEGGHVVSPYPDGAPDVSGLVGGCVAAVGYRDGPFHVDLIFQDDGVRILEMGFRLSGLGLAGLVRRVTGVDWAEAVFRVHLRDAPPLGDDVSAEGERRYGGQLALRGPAELRAAEALRMRHGAEVVEVHRYPKPITPSSWSGGPPASMTADLHRYARTAGRVFVYHGQRATVAHLLAQCAGATPIV